MFKVFDKSKLKLSKAVPESYVNF